jgi:hypothetical protein
MGLIDGSRFACFAPLDLTRLSILPVKVGTWIVKIELEGPLELAIYEEVSNWACKL